MKLSTFCFVLVRNGKEIPFENLTLEERMEYRKKFTEDFMDDIMRGKGYQRKAKTTA